MHFFYHCPCGIINISGFRKPGDAIGWFKDDENITVDSTIEVVATNDFFKVLEIMRHRRDNALVWTKANLKYLREKS